MSDIKIETVCEIINEAPEYRNPGAGFFRKISFMLAYLIRTYADMNIHPFL